ncbi:MAG TPA: SRPBCC domain-containing protein, partial [Candidatus Limnocylindrales bacterium]|nr:SRPBCC domain-containing protein [Candidatus Limnocylindrales bacterium]
AVNRTISAPIERLRSAFIEPAVRRRWLADGSLRRRPNTATNTARFDWSEPPSRVVVTFDAKSDTKTQVAVGHERLPDAETAERMKGWWRERLGALKQLLEDDQA